MMILAGMTCLLSISPAREVAAQNIFNPYGNSGYADYREFARPEASNNPSLPGQARLQGAGIGGGSRSNQFEAYSNSLNGREPDTSEGTRNGRPAAAAGVPYFQAYRLYDEQYKRVYKPNDSSANRKYENLMKQRNALYAKAADEKDPVKRARLVREIQAGLFDRPGTTVNERTPAAPPASRASAARAPAPPASRAPVGTTPRSAATPTRPVPVPTQPVAPAPRPAAPASISEPSSVPIPPPR